MWFAKELDRLQHVASGVTGVTAGTLLGLFTLGIVFSRANCSVSNYFLVPNVNLLKFNKRFTVMCNSGICSITTKRV